MSLQDPRKKMSKTDNPLGCIGLFDEPEEIKIKIMKAVTDTGSTIKYDSKTKPGISNLLTIYSLFAETPLESVEKKFKANELSTRDVYIREILEQGRKKAQTIAQSTIQEVKSKMGLI